MCQRPHQVARGKSSLHRGGRLHHDVSGHFSPGQLPMKFSEDLYAPGFTVDTGRADLATKTTANGLFAVTGYPDHIFPKPCFHQLSE